MERRVFIQKSSFALLSILTPVYFWIKKDYQVINLNPKKLQIRHGMLDNCFDKIDENLEIQRNLFLKNGHSEGLKDVLNINIRFNASKQNYSVFHSENQTEVRGDNRISVHSLKNKSTIQLANCYVLPLNGEIIINNQQISSNEIVKIGNEKIAINSNAEKVNFLIIS